MPVSCTSIVKRGSGEVGERVASNRIPPRSVNLMAFPTRFVSNCLNRAGSVKIVSGTPLVQRHSRVRFFSWAGTRNMESTSLMI